MTDLPLKLTLKSGAGYDAPWLTIDASDPTDLAAKIAGLKAGDLLQDAIELADLFKAAGAIGSNVPTPTVNNGPTAQQAAAPGWAQPAAAAPAAAPAQPGVQFHPEGIKCPSCQSAVVFKQITSKKTGKQFQLWTCPNQRSSGDGHYSEFAN